jgi:uncharacterized phage protein (TIGR01671 family)
VTETRRETMGREIKFRAWDKERCEYLSGGNVLLVIHPGRGERKTTMCLDLFQDHDLYKERFIIEQFTGLRDKAGREIFEADIVRFDVAAGHGEPAVKRQRGEVSFSGGVVSFGPWACLWCGNVEVIGNVHENPELLGGRP